MPDDDRSARRRLALIADDDAANRQLLEVLLDREGCRVMSAADGRQALAAADAVTPDIVLLDIEMPGVDGIEVTRELRNRAATAIVPIILLTGRTALDDKVAGLDAGATDFVTKPFVASELSARVRSALRLKAAIDRLEDAQGVLVALANAVEAKDRHTEDHCARLAGMATELARMVGVDDDTLEAIGYGAALHDVGKIGIAEDVLLKPAALTENEWAQMRRHPLIGAAIIEPLRLGRRVAPIVRSHHERWDGDGYPDGLRGDAIPFGARIVAVVDTFDAITHDRPYRVSRSPDEARAILRSVAGSQLDPALVEAFVSRPAGRSIVTTASELTIRGLRSLVPA